MSNVVVTLVCRDCKAEIRLTPHGYTESMHLGRPITHADVGQECPKNPSPE